MVGNCSPKHTDVMGRTLYSDTQGILTCSCWVIQSCPTLQPHVLQDTRLPCLSLSPWVCSTSCPLSQWCHPTISSSVTHFFSCLQSFPASGSFPTSWLFTSGGQSIGASAWASVLPVNISTDFLWDWLIGSPCSPRDSQGSSPTPQFKFFGTQLSLWSNSHIHTWLLETP